jgi:hypothetical protein
MRRAVGAQWAIIGGLAVATRAAPRFTQDVDFAVSVRDDAEAEDIVHRMSVRGYGVGMTLEQDYAHRGGGMRESRTCRPTTIRGPGSGRCPGATAPWSGCWALTC